MAKDGTPAKYGLPEPFKVGILNWQHYLNDEFELMTAKYGILYENVKTKGDGQGQAEVDRLVKKCKEKGIHIILSLAECTNKLQSRVNTFLGYPGVSDLSLLSCSSKFISRGMDLETLWRVPVDPYVKDLAEFEPMLARVPQWPCILKTNLHTGGGSGVFCIRSPGGLLQKLLEIRADTAFFDVIEKEKQWYLDGIPKGELKEEVPFYHVEEMVRLGPGCIQYCVDGYVDENGKVGVWGIFEEMYTPTDMTFGYVTPPINMRPEEGPKIGEYVKAYVQKLVDQGWKNQAFCAELWYRAKEGKMWMTEVNPRAAWAYSRSYRHTYGKHLIQVCTLAAAGKGSMMWLDGKITKGPALVTVVSPTRAGRVGDLIDYDHINDLRAKGRLVRDMERPETIIRQEDVHNAAGYWVLYVYYHGKDIKDLARQEKEDRAGFHVFPQLEFDYPAFWPAEAPVRKNSILLDPQFACLD